MSKILSIGCFMLNIIIELLVIPSLKIEINDKLYVYLGIFLFFFTLSLKFKYKKVPQIFYLLTIFALLLALYPFYQSVTLKNINQYTDVLLIAGIVSFYFLVLAPYTYKSQNEFEESEYAFNVYNLLYKMVFIHLMIRLFQKQNTKVNIHHIDYSKILNDVCLVFFVLLGWKYLSDFMVREENKSKGKNIVLKALFGLFVIFVCKGIYIAIMNKEICNFAEKVLYDRIPQPHNVILMNMFGQSKIQKIKIFSALLVYLI